MDVNPWRANDPLFDVLQYSDTLESIEIKMGKWVNQV